MDPIFFLCLHYSKQRHNRLWHPDSECDHPDCQQAAAPCCSNAEGITHNPTTPGITVCCEPAAHSSPISLDLDPAHPQNFHYYFRCLSDSALDSEPSTPIHAPPLVDVNRVYIEVADVEKDALLDENLPLPHFAVPGDGTAAQTCSRGAEPLEELRLRLEFSTVQEENEEEAQKEQEEMESKPSDERGIDLASLNHTCNENSNNNNHLRKQHNLTVSALDHIKK